MVNSPLASLVDIFRSWFPRTAADIDQRVAALDTLIAHEPDAAFDLLERLVHIGPDTHRIPPDRVGEKMTLAPGTWLRLLSIARCLLLQLIGLLAYRKVIRSAVPN